MTEWAKTDKEYWWKYGLFCCQPVVIWLVRAYMSFYTCISINLWRYIVKNIWDLGNIVMKIETTTTTAESVNKSNFCVTLTKCRTEWPSGYHNSITMISSISEKCCIKLVKQVTKMVFLIYRKNSKLWDRHVEQTMQTQSSLLLNGAVWSGPPLLAIPSASFARITTL